ncbi:MAG: NAD(P)H-dependent oxidoreductase [Candidatus Omnitrophota bacterium]|nr:MAG: NAD(P)H-dependent oxidoreductase [Candidatus Omnitrophota bacterium]
MKTAIIYYSFTGNTHRIAYLFADILKNKSEEAVLVRIRPLKEPVSFLQQCKEAFLARKPELYRTLLDLKDFDRIIIGSPVWAFRPAPAINTYIEQCGSLQGKTAICFVTYGSGAGKDKALGVMKKALVAKGARVVGTLSLQQGESEKQCREKLSEIL